MNDILYKIPPIITAAVGGLWYFAATNSDPWLLAGVFCFAAIFCIVFIGVMARFSLSFRKYIYNINKFDGDYNITLDRASRCPSTIKLIHFLILGQQLSQ